LADGCEPEAGITSGDWHGPDSLLGGFSSGGISRQNDSEYSETKTSCLGWKAEGRCDAGCASRLVRRCGPGPWSDPTDDRAAQTVIGTLE
jgi:hypothetical protein